MGYEGFTIEADTLRFTVPGGVSSGVFLGSFNAPNAFYSFIYDSQGMQAILVDLAAYNINLRIISDAGFEHYVDNMQRVNFSNLLHYGLIRLHWNSIVTLTTTTLLLPCWRVTPSCCIPKCFCNGSNN